MRRELKQRDAAWRPESMTRYFIAGNYWLTFALLLFLGRKLERSNPTRYSIFGGGWLDPSSYILLILLTLGLATLCFGLMWMTRARGGEADKGFSRAVAEFEETSFDR